MSNIAIVLSAGSGKRMHSDVKKQYMMLCERELISYSLDVFEKSDIITDVILVVSAEDIEYCRENIVKKYGFSKVRSIIPGGRERYHSVMAGLDEIERLKDAGEIVSDGRDFVYIHDGARPFITHDMIARLHDEVTVSEACVAAVRSKDTVKIANSADYVVSTPNRDLTWIIQTPQVFEYALVKEAYDILKEEECGLPCQGITVTDDAMVVETWSKHRVKLIEGSYSNIKITTPEDMILGEAIIKGRINN
jgi:2-C-methyl-D-erythritol 4-phosphate cytidylyltransferase